MNDVSAYSINERLEAIALDIELTQSGAILRVGQGLYEARGLFRHKRDEGGFEGWLENRLSLPRSTAYKIISVYEKFGSESVSRLDTLPRGVLYELAAPSTPEPVRQETLARAASGEKISVADVKELKAKLAEKDEKLRTLKTQKHSADTHNSRLIDDIRSKTNECHRLSETIENLKEEIRRLSESGTITLKPRPATNAVPAERALYGEQAQLYDDRQKAAKQLVGLLLPNYDITTISEIIGLFEVSGIYHVKAAVAAARVAEAPDGVAQ